MPRLWPHTIRMPDQIQSLKGSENSTSSGQSYQKKTRAMVAKSHEDGEEAFRCVNMERPRSSGNSKEQFKWINQES